MKYKINLFYSIFISTILVWFSVNSFFGKVAFGYGLADIIYLIALWVITFVFLITVIINLKKSTNLSITNIIFSIPIIWILLSATICRGSEYSWNNKILLHKCEKKIQIISKGKSRSVNVKMCPMEYYSTFRGKWNHSKLILEAGEIKIPDKVKKYIDYPIIDLIVEPIHQNHESKDGSIKIKYNFEIDSLKEGMNYGMRGEIVKVIDRIPVFKAKMQ